MRTLQTGLWVVGIALLVGCAESEASRTTKAGSSSDDRLVMEIAVTQHVEQEAGAPPTLQADAGEVGAGQGDAGQVDAGAEVDSAGAAIESANVVKSVTFDHIKFEMTKGDKFRQRMLTDNVKELFGKNIRIRGYILPSFKQDGLTRFVLVRDNKECCFGPGAALFDCIAVKMVDDKTTSYTVRLVSVEGTFSFEKVDNPDPKRPGELLSIYRLDAVRVK